MSDSNYIDQIAALIKKDPSITVRQIANELQFADSKSVYYWLDKSNVSGIKEFKRLVLGDTSSALTPVSVEIEGVLHYVVNLPLLDWNPKQKNHGKEWCYLHNHPHPRGLFAIRVDTGRYSPWFMPEDVLVVSKTTAFPEGSWALLGAPSEFVIGNVINNRVVDPITLKPHRPGLKRVGVIIHQQRYFSS